MTTHTMPSTTARYEWVPSDSTLLGWTYNPGNFHQGTALATQGLLRVWRLKVPVGGSCTNILMCLTSVGSALTNSYAALWNSSGTLIGQTADQSTAWTTASPTLKAMPLVGGPYTLAAGDYYVGAWYNGTTGPTFARGASLDDLLLNVGRTAPNFRAATANTSLTTTAPPSLGTQSSTAVLYWAGLN